MKELEEEEMKSRGNSRKGKKTSQMWAAKEERAQKWEKIREETAQEFEQEGKKWWRSSWRKKGRKKLRRSWRWRRKNWRREGRSRRKKTQEGLEAEEKGDKA